MMMQRASSWAFLLPRSNCLKNSFSQGCYLTSKRYTGQISRTCWSVKYLKKIDYTSHFDRLCSPCPSHHACSMSFYSTASKLKQPEIQDDHEDTSPAKDSSVTKTSQNATVKEHSTSETREDNVENINPAKPGLIRGIFKRFKDTYKEYGKALVAVHCVTSSMWFGSFYYAAAAGIDMVSLLHKIGASENVIEHLSSSGLGNVAVAYLLYKLATPARYTVTIVGTQLTVRYLRRWGYMAPVPEGDSLRELLREGRSEMAVKYQAKKGEMMEKMEEMKEKADEMKDDMTDRLIEKASDFKDELSSKYKTKSNEGRDNSTKIKQRKGEELKHNVKKPQNTSHEIKSHDKVPKER